MGLFDGPCVEQRYACRDMARWRLLLWRSCFKFPWRVFHRLRYFSAIRVVPLASVPTGSLFLPPSDWTLPIVLYTVSAAGNLLLLLPGRGASVASDPTGGKWEGARITAATALVSIFVMGALLRSHGRGCRIGTQRPISIFAINALVETREGLW